MLKAAFATLGLLACMLAACAPSAELACAIPDGTDPLPAALREASGIAASSGDHVWIIADSGPPLLYAVDAANTIVARVRVAGFAIEDWEGLARGPCGNGAHCLFIGDIGDNLHVRDDIAILRVEEPLVTDSVAVAERFPIRFPDGPSDTEALIARADGSLLVITKGRNRAVGVYRYPSPLRRDTVVTLEHLNDLGSGIVQLPEQVTGAGGTPDGRFVLVRTYAGLQLHEIGDAGLVPIGRPLRLAALREGQGEGVAITADGDVVLVGEAPDSGTIARLRCTVPQ